MWDDRRKVGVLNGLGYATFGDREDAGGRNDPKTMPFLALDLLEEGMSRKIPRLYRHHAESFGWCLFYLCFTTVKDKDGQNCTKNPNPLQRWFTTSDDCWTAKTYLLIRRRDFPDYIDPRMAYPNTEDLTRRLAAFWNRVRQTQKEPTGYGVKVIPSDESPPYEEPDDERFFTQVVAAHEDALGSETLREVCEDFAGMRLSYQKVDWSN